MMNEPKSVIKILNRLAKHGYEAYLVGGCVRDALLGNTPHDWDITTSALPNRILELFSPQYTCITTGVKHGTIGIVMDSEVYEATTFRSDGAYKDFRHPDQVTFVRSLKEDLARRDFTVNAMAYHPEVGVIDPFGGKRDLQNKQIRCVGEASKRYSEDALRIMRALRFASVLGFTIEEESARFAFLQRELLKQIARERILSELQKLLLGQYCDQVIESFWDVIAVCLPALHMVGQQNRQVICRMLSDAPQNLCVRFAVLLSSLSPEQARSELQGLKATHELTKTVTQLIEHQELQLPTDLSQMLFLLNRFGEPFVRLLLQFQSLLTKSKRNSVYNNQILVAERRLDQVMQQKLCYTLKEMQIKGADLIELGFCPGKQMGEALSALLNQVMIGTLPNKKESLYEAAKCLL